MWTTVDPANTSPGKKTTPPLKKSTISLAMLFEQCGVKRNFWRRGLQWEETSKLQGIVFLVLSLN